VNLSKVTWRVLTDEEVAVSEAVWRWGPDLEGKAWRSLFIHLCEQAGGHDWYLTIDPDDGTWFTCQNCPAGMDDVYPDGTDLLTGEFEVRPGYVLGLRTGGVLVNGQPCDEFDGWHGPVTVELHTEKYTSMDWIGYEYDAWIDVEAKRDA
jgi:hypothetical protein